MASIKKTLLLTGASRGIGHATVKHFHAAEWRVITVSRQPFDKICPWPQGEKDHGINRLQISCINAEPRCPLAPVKAIFIAVVVSVKVI
ncbi:MAG TPA: hypothetical protein PLZ45_08920 [Ferruginibacter sp.]|nr:hypothetical protein [Ferruginibacter sp.]